MVPNTPMFNIARPYRAKRKEFVLFGVKYVAGDPIPREVLEKLPLERGQALVGSLYIEEDTEYEPRMVPKASVHKAEDEPADPQRASSRPTGEGMETFADKAAAGSRDKATLASTPGPEQRKAGKPFARHKGGGKYVIVDESGHELPEILSKAAASRRIEAMIATKAEVEGAEKTDKK